MELFQTCKTLYPAVCYVERSGEFSPIHSFRDYERQQITLVEPGRQFFSAFLDPMRRSKSHLHYLT